MIQKQILINLQNEVLWRSRPRAASDTKLKHEKIPKLFFSLDSTSINSSVSLTANRDVKTYFTFPLHKGTVFENVLSKRL